LPGGVYYKYITAGIGVFWWWTGARVRFLLFISDGGRYGMDSVIELVYKGAVIPPADYKFHPGTLTKQIEPVVISAVDASTNVITSADHPFFSDDPVRLHSRGGILPAPLTDAVKYFVVSRTRNTFKVAETPSGTAIDLTTAGTGTLTVWRADAGFDDPVQGLPQYCPQTNTTFSGICYVEGELPAVYSTAEEPEWSEFRIRGIGRKLMDYDAAGGELGLATGRMLGNPALCAADALIVEYKKPLSRIDFASLFQLRQSAPVQVWQRRDTSQKGTGAIAAYYNYPGGASAPNVATDGTLAFTRRDATIDHNWAASNPMDLITGNFFVVWKFFLKAKYTQTYTFTLEHDDGARLFVGAVAVINNWTVGSTTDTGTIALTAGALVECRVEVFEGGGDAKCKLSWQSASQPFEIVPQEAMFDGDLEIDRYIISIAFAVPTEAAVVFEKILNRCPGWDWTEGNGKIIFLPPGREIVYDFVFDASDDDAAATFLDKTFEKKRKNRRERRNFALYSFRNEILYGYPEEFVEENRPRLRELGGGMPNNDAPADLMVMPRGQAQRVADMDFKLTTDVSHAVSLVAQKPAGVVTKNSLARVRNWVKGDKRIEDAVCLVESVNRQGNRLDFEFIPIVEPFYTDEEV
jgi:hypothetical protein